ncbi:FHA domain-containing protein [Micromonospora siamensis]|uniref:DUF1828 domain-containing protein n=1 Tax=Micromonospora siamensis TaxID=299152 RepID=A0A1C5GLQ9_9ACTN|nr:DUF1828 domain-containing protein [Micromonospora siamensis]SCG34748.1 protein of unknown function DUF1828 [Micromonospora siamensis]
MVVDASTVIGAVLRAVNDNTVVYPYGDGLLVDLPLTYGDGDGVRVLVEPMGSGYRVTDRAAAASLLTMAGVNLSAGRAAEAFAEIMASGGLNGVNAAAGEITTFGITDDLGKLVLDVAQASLRVDQLRWLAPRQAGIKFVDRVTDRVTAWAGRSRKLQRDAPIPLESGRSRSVTLRVANDGKAAYVQAVSLRDPDQAAEHCYHVFGLSKIARESRVAALDGSAHDWPPAIVAELRTVSDVEFFDDPLSLERQLDKVVPPSQPALRA